MEVAKSLIKQDGKYLLLKRSSNSTFFPNLWDFPGGKVRPEEDTTSALIRETAEETSLNVTPGEKIGDYNYTEQHVPIHFHLFQVDTFEGDVQLSEDHSDSIWLSEEELDNYDLAPIVKLFFNLM